MVAALPEVCLLWMATKWQLCYSLTRKTMRHGIWAAVTMFGLAASIRAQPSPNTSLFAQQIRPILEQQCQTCHGGAAKQSGLEITTREKLLRGGDHGPAVVPGKPEESRLHL